MPTNGKHDPVNDELTELKKRHSKTLTRADRLSTDMETSNQAARDLLEAYRRADEALERSRRP